MSRTGLDAATLANSLRMKAGDGSVEWAYEPMQVSVLLDIADMLDENAKLRQELEAVGTAAYLYGRTDLADENARLRELLLHMHTCKGNVDADGNHECFSCEYEGAECDFDRRMRELGIEVPE